MNDCLEKFKIYSPTGSALDWGFISNQLVDFATALQQPLKIAALPIYFNQADVCPNVPELSIEQATQFDLILFSDIQYYSQNKMVRWINAKFPKTKWLLSLGGINPREIPHEKSVYQPWWMFNLMNIDDNQISSNQTYVDNRPFLFECLLGARRQHRDSVFLWLQQHQLLSQGIVTYRQCFNLSEGPLDSTYLPLWPYVSENLPADWEVQETVDNTVSDKIPWKIYNQCWFSLITETTYDKNTLLVTEKMGKCLLGRRFFIHIGSPGYLKFIQNLGFQTFSNFIDESYDDILDDNARWEAALTQLLFLQKQNHSELMSKAKPILDHNFNRLYELREEITKTMKTKIYNEALNFYHGKS